MATALESALLRDAASFDPEGDPLDPPKWNDTVLERLPKPRELAVWANKMLASGRGFADPPPQGMPPIGVWPLGLCQERLYLWRVYGVVAGPKNPAVTEFLSRWAGDVADIIVRLGVLIDTPVSPFSPFSVGSIEPAYSPLA